MKFRVVHLTRGIKATLKSVRNRAWIAAASLMRRTLTRTTFVGVTGSAGKTTAKELLVGILSRHMQGHGTLATANYPLHVAKLVCATKRTDRFCVAELGLLGPGDFDDVVRIVRPRIGVVTSIGGDHVGAFGSLEAIAEEKGKPVDALPVDGTAILNADDPLVMAMRARSVARVIGTASGSPETPLNKRIESRAHRSGIPRKSGNARNPLPYAPSRSLTMRCTGSGEDRYLAHAAVSSIGTPAASWGAP